MAVLEQVQNGAAAQAGGVALFERREDRAVETRKAVDRAEPEVTGS